MCRVLREGDLAVKILNTHIATEEHDWLRAEAKRTEQTITAVLRGLIRAAKREQERAEVARVEAARATRMRLVAGKR